MRANGWVGRPLLVVADGISAAMTGTHRLAAAREALVERGEDVPCFVVEHIEGCDGPGWENCLACELPKATDQDERAALIADMIEAYDQDDPDGAAREAWGPALELMLAEIEENEREEEA